MSFMSTRKPISEWKWYIRKRDFSIHRSSDPIEEGIEITPPPGKEEHYTWDWEKNDWIINSSQLKRRAMRLVQDELIRLTKFNDIEPADKLKIQDDLSNYRNQLRMFIKNFNHLSDMPSLPQSLTEENFFEL